MTLFAAGTRKASKNYKDICDSLYDYQSSILLNEFYFKLIHYNICYMTEKIIKNFYI